MPSLIHRRLRAPQDDGAALVEPPLQQIPLAVERNQVLQGTYRALINAQPLVDVILPARSEVLAQAIAHTNEQRDVSWLPTAMNDAPLIMAGHQPELFHPGVWSKNFLLSTLAKTLGGVAVNLIVDTDTLRTTTIRVPTRAHSDATIENIAFDASGSAIPFEERPVLDRWLIESFAERVLAAYGECFSNRHVPYQPILREIWLRDVVGEQGDSANLGVLLAKTRHLYEGRLGLQTLEVPLSQVAQTRHFRLFTANLLMQLPIFWQVYNAALAEYRLANHIRSSTHPVPSLREQDDWLEAPFYLWSIKDPRRRPVFVRQVQDAIVLSDRHDVKVLIDVSPGDFASGAAERLAAAESRGIKIRPRALITTMYARLVLSDLFIHGIGGAKYDELTDLIIRRFFGIEPPAYVTATATFRLPVERPDVTLDDVRASAVRVRDMRYRPESFLRDPRVTSDTALAPKLAALAADKREFLDHHDMRRCSKDVFDQLDRINGALRDLLRPVEEESRARHAELIAQLKQSQLLGSREFSFVLYPSEILPARLLDLCKVLS